MRFLDGIPETRKNELLGQLRAVWTHDSTAIEGNTLTLGDTMFVLGCGLTVKGKPLKDQVDVQNHARAVDAFFEIVRRGRLTEEDLFTLHRLVINEQSCDIYKPVGAYKREDNGTYLAVDGKSVYHAYLPADDVPAAMRAWLVEFNGSCRADASRAEVIDAYARAHVRFTAIHPFFDGNGRLARLISNLPALVAGYPPIVVPTERREEYIDALRTYEQDGKNLLPLKELLRESWQVTVELVDQAKGKASSADATRPPSPAAAGFPQLLAAVLGAFAFAAVAAPVATTAISATNYVQNGLVAFYDGIENAGAGLHDDAATTWKNLASGASDATLPAGKYKICDTCVAFTKSVASVTGVTCATNATPITLETCVRPTSAKGSYNIPCLQIASRGEVGFDSRNNQGVCISVPETSTTTASKLAFHWYGKWNYDSIALNKTHTLSAVLPVSSASTLKDSAFLDGVSMGSDCVTYWTTPSVQSVPSGAMTIANAGVSHNVYISRVYSRKLSADEIAHNARIDAMRFGARACDWREDRTTGCLEYRVSVAQGAGGVATLGGAAAPAEAWYGLGTTNTVTFAATPDEGQEFVCWTGDTDSFTVAQRTSASLTCDAAEPLALKPVFQVSGTSRWRYAGGIISNATTDVALTVSASGKSLTATKISNLPGASVDLRGAILTDDAAVYNLVSIGTIFKGNATITDVYLPETITSISANAFDYCYELRTVSPMLPDAVTSVGNYAFRKCTNLTGKVSMHGVKSLGTGAFESTKVREIDLDGAPITYFGAGNYSSVTNFHPLLPATLSGTQPPSWNGGLLGGKQKLCLAAPNWTSLCSDNVRYMPWTEVDMTGSSIATMGSWAFYGCSSMTSVTFSAAFKTFPNVNQTFGGCGNIKWVRFRGDPPEAITTNPFGAHNGMSYYLPKWNENWETYLAGDENRALYEMTSTECEYFRAAHPGEPIPVQRLSIGGAGTAWITTMKGISWWYPDAPPVYREVSLFDLLGYDGKKVVTNGVPVAAANQNAALLFDGTTYSYNTGHTGFRWLATTNAPSAEVTLPTDATTARAMRLEGYRLHQLPIGYYPNSRAPTAWTLSAKSEDDGAWIELDSVAMTAASRPCWAYLTNSTYKTTGTSQTTPARAACSLTYALPKAKWGRYVAFKFTPTNSYNRANGIADDYPFGLMELELLGELTTSEPNIDAFSVSRNGWNDLAFSFDLNSIGDPGVDGKTPKTAVAWVEVAAKGDTGFTNVVAASSVAAVTAGTGKQATVAGLSGNTAYEAQLVVSNDLGLVSRMALSGGTSTLAAPYELGALTVTTNAQGRLTASLEVKALYVASVTVDLAYRTSIAAVVQNLGSTTVTETGTVVFDAFTTGVTPTATSLVDATVTGDGIAQTLTSTPFGFWVADAATPTRISNTVTRATFSVTVASTTNLTLSAIRDFGDSTSFDFTKLIAKPDGSALALVSPGTAFYSNIDIEEMILPDTVTAIPNNAFDNCSRLARVRLPAMLKSIGQRAFFGCVKLANVENLFPTSCVTISSLAFNSCYLLPNFKLSPHMTVISSQAFYGCHSITELDIPDSVVYIEGGAFQDTPNLKTIRPRYLPHQIRTSALCCFHDSSGAKGPLVLDNPKMTSISSDGFRYSAGITSIDMLGSNIKSIGTLAFFGANSLTWVRFATNAVTIAQSDNSGNRTFHGNDLREIVFPGEPPILGSTVTSPFSSSYYIIRIPRRNAAWVTLLAEHAEKGWLTEMTEAERATFRTRYPKERTAARYWLNLRGVTGKRYLKYLPDNRFMVIVR